MTRPDALPRTGGSTLGITTDRPASVPEGRRRVPRGRGRPMSSPRMDRRRPRSSRPRSWSRGRSRPRDDVRPRTHRGPGRPGRWVGPQAESGACGRPWVSQGTSGPHYASSATGEAGGFSARRKYRHRDADASSGSGRPAIVVRQQPGGSKARSDRRRSERPAMGRGSSSVGPRARPTLGAAAGGGQRGYPRTHAEGFSPSRLSPLWTGCENGHNDRQPPIANISIRGRLGVA
jgi:hypothetical protein